MAKQLKFWNGRGQGNGKYKNGHLYVAAYSRKHAAHMINLALKSWVTEYEIRKYFSQCWGNPMQGITPTKPCVFASISNEKPIKIYHL